MYKTRKRAFFMEITEHFFRLAVRLDITQVYGDTTKEWHRKTREWLEEECTADERKIIKDFYTYNQTVSKCSNFVVVDKVSAIAKRYAIAMGLC